MIKINNLTYKYNSFKKESGVLGSFKDLYRRQKEEIIALENISLTINQGEIIGLLGENGAGKTTLIKLMSGILTPVQGEILCNKYNPSKREKSYLKSIGTVIGQKSQLIWDLPPEETLNMLRVIYEIEESEYQKRLQHMCSILAIKDKLKTPVRKLSMGQRIKFELVCSLIHNPKLLFLDEPTIGLDIVSQKNIYEFLKTLNKENKTTIILTSHYMKDIEALTQRIVILVKGRIVENLSLDKLLDKYNLDESMHIIFKQDIPNALLSYKNQEVEAPEIILSEKEVEDYKEMINISDIKTMFNQKDNLEDIIYHLFKDNRGD